MIFILNNQYWRYYKPIYIYIFNYSYPFPITNLKLFNSAFLFYIYNNYSNPVDNAHYKTRFVKVIEIVILDIVLRIYIFY